MDGDTQKGYTITFKKSGAITLLNGQKGDKGDKGDTPLVSLKQEKDGNWYWTLNGSLMTDVSGAPIRANGTNRTNGTPAPTPQLKTGRQLKVDSVAGNWQDDDPDRTAHTGSGVSYPEFPTVRSPLRPHTVLRNG